LNGHKLIHAIEAHNKLYADTLQLTTAEVDTLVRFIQYYKLNTSVKKELKPTYESKLEHDEEIRGSITLAGQTAGIDIRAAGFHLLEEDPVGKKLQELEAILNRYMDLER
jgi:hypothetical protein